LLEKLYDAQISALLKKLDIGLSITNCVLFNDTEVPDGALQGAKVQLDNLQRKLFYIFIAPPDFQTNLFTKMELFEYDISMGIIKNVVSASNLV
jgi:hypothetical protein